MKTTNGKYVILFKNVILLLLVISSLNYIKAQSLNQKTYEFAPKIDELLNKAVELDLFSGCVLVAKEDKAIFSGAYGEANKDFHIKNTLDTKFNIASGTKPFTSVSIMLLLQECLISINDPVTKYLPDFPFGDTITIFHLLTHTSGLGHYTREYAKNKHNVRGFESFLNDYVYKETLRFEPGSEFYYSNSGVIVLGAIIEKVSGLKYAEFLKKYIFEPLNMNNTISAMPEEIIENRASGYIHKISGGYLETSLSVCPPTSATGLRTTVNDLFKFIQAVHSNKLLKKEYRKMMFTPYLDDDLGPYAFLWDVLDGCIYTNCQGTVIGHRGGQPGFETLYYYYLNKKYSIILMSNYENSRKVYPMIEAIVFGNEYDLPKLPVDRFLYSMLKGKNVQLDYDKVQSILASNNYKVTNPYILNNAGYSLIRDDDIETALKYFLLNVFLFKDNSNAYDSLGEAYMLNEQNELAIKYFQRSLELNPDNENARERLNILN